MGRGYKLTSNMRGLYYETLLLCPNCGMDSGQRLVRHGSKDKFFVRCETCGWRTFDTSDTAHATREWNKKSKERNR